MSCKASAAWEVIGMCCRFYIKENDTAFMPILEGAESSPLFPRFQKSYTFDRRALVPDKVESITRLLSS